MKACHACGTPWEEQHNPGRMDRCLKCGADMHCCLNCKMYDPTKGGQCSSRTAEPPTDKVSVNSCDEFMIADRTGPIQSSEDRQESLKDKWDSLFKN